jgi:hypothetical protein
VRTSKLLLSDIGLFTGVSSDKSPGDSLLFKQSALRGVSYALTHQRMAKVDDLIKRWAKQIVLTIVAWLAHGFLQQRICCQKESRNA